MSDEGRTHYIDAIMSAVASQITGVPIVCLTVYSGADQRKHQNSATGGFPSQRASNRKFEDVIMELGRHLSKQYLTANLDP